MYTDWTNDYDSKRCRGPMSTRPIHIPSKPPIKMASTKPVKSATMSRAGGSSNKSISTHRQRMANQKSSPFKRRQSDTVTKTSTNQSSKQEGNMPTVATRSSRKSPSTRPARAKTTAKKGVVLHLVREPTGKGGYRYDNSHDRDEKLDITTAYVSQRDVNSTKPLKLALVAEPKGKGGVRFANTAKEKLDVTTMYLSQHDRALLGAGDSVTLKITDDGVTVTP